MATFAHASHHECLTDCPTARAGAAGAGVWLVGTFGLCDLLHFDMAKQAALNVGAIVLA
jgi:hypothetical protein